jgi:hypothetical protein
MTDRSAKRPSFQWYPGDAQRDTALRACSLEARGLWREMMDLMHDGEPYGHLTAGGVVISPAELSRIVGVSAKRCVSLLGDLESRGVFSRTPEGVIFSRRMVRDERIRATRAASGRLGGNPILVNQPDNQPSKQKPTPATATAFAVAVEGIDDAINRFAAAANKGLAEHPTHPQAVPRIMASSGRSRQATEIILTAEVPVPFAEAEIYRLAKSHKADGQVTSLNYFVGGVCRAWEQEGATQAAGNSRPALRAVRGRGGVGQRTYDNAVEALKDFPEAG